MLAQSRPCAGLLGEPSQVQSQELFAKMDAYYRRQVLEARKELENLFDPVVVDFGPRSFDDFPLKETLRNGYLIGMDIDGDSMQSARAGLDSQENERLATLTMDASLAANEIAAATDAVFTLNSDLDEAHLVALIKAYDELEFNRQLPIDTASVDFAVSNGVLSAFTVYPHNYVVESLSHLFGQRTVWDFFTARASFSPHLQRGRILDQAFGRLYRRIAGLHFQEVGRVLRQGGILQISDHSLYIQGFAWEGTLTNCRRDDFYPRENLDLDISLGIVHPSLDVRVGTEIKGLEVEGKDSLDAMVRAQEDLRVLSTNHFWGVNRLESEAFDLSGEYVIVTSAVLQKPF